MRSPSADQVTRVAWPARMSLMTLSLTAWSKFGVKHRGPPPARGTTHKRSSSPASRPLGAMKAIRSPFGDQIGELR